MLSSKLISIIIGLIVVLGTGSAVYQKKQNSLLPENNVNIVNTPAGGTEKNLVPKTPTISHVEYDGEIEGDDDADDGGTKNSVVTTPTPKPTTPTPTPVTPSGITMAQVATHSSRSSCWSVVDNNVYDLTSWIPNHPGGERQILSMCGVDGSASYHGQHGSSGRPAAILAGFKLGALAK